MTSIEVEPAETSNRPVTVLPSIAGSPASNERSAIASAREVATAMLPSATIVGPSRPVPEPWLDDPAHRDRPRHALDPSHQLPERSQPAAVEQQPVGHADLATVRREGRFEQVGVRQVAACHRGRDIRLQGEATPLAGVEDRREHRGRVEIRQGEPVDRTIESDERDGAPVADRRVVADRRIPPGFAVHGPLSRCGGRVRDDDLIRDRHPGGGDRSIRAEQPAQGFAFLRAGDEPEHAARSRQTRVGQGHPPATLVPDR